MAMRLASIINGPNPHEIPEPTGLMATLRRVLATGRRTLQAFSLTQWFTRTLTNATLARDGAGAGSCVLVRARRLVFGHYSLHSLSMGCCAQPSNFQMQRRPPMAEDSDEEVSPIYAAESPPFATRVDPATQERWFNELKVFHLAAYGPGSTLLERHERNMYQNCYAGRFYQLVRSKVTGAMRRSISEIGMDLDDLLNSTYIKFHGMSKRPGREVTRSDIIHSFEDNSQRKGFVAFLKYLRRTMGSVVLDEIRRRGRDSLEREFRPEDENAGITEARITAQPLVDHNQDYDLHDPDLTAYKDGANALDELLADIDKQKAKQLYSIDIAEGEVVEPLRGEADNIAREFIARSKTDLQPFELEILVAYAKTPRDHRAHGWNKDYAKKSEGRIINTQVSRVLVEKTGFGLKLFNQSGEISEKPACDRRDWVSNYIAKLVLSDNPEFRGIQECLVRERVIAKVTQLIECGELDGGNE